MFKKYRHKESGEIVKFKGFGTRLEECGKATTMIWIKSEAKDKSEFIRACDFDRDYEVIRGVNNDK